jgi:hypothetical protein
MNVNEEVDLATFLVKSSLKSAKNVRKSSSKIFMQASTRLAIDYTLRYDISCLVLAV